MFVEVARHLGDRNNIVNVSTVTSERVNSEKYISLYIYTSDVLDYIAENIVEKDGKKYNSILNYDGDVSFSTFYIDIDRKGKSQLENLQDALFDTSVLIKKLYFTYEIPYEDILIYFSGGKGFHIGIKDKSFGLTRSNFRKDTNEIHKILAEKICYPDIKYDTVIYNKTRLFRAPNSKHQESGLYKTQISYELILSGDIEKIIELSRENKVEINYKPSGSKINQLNELYFQCAEEYQSKIENIDRNLTKAVNDSLFSIPRTGERNDKFYKMAYRLFNQKDLKVSEVVDIMKMIYELANSYYSDKIETNEFNNLLKSAKNRVRGSEKVKSAIETITAGSMLSSVFSQIAFGKRVKTISAEVDEDTRGGLITGNLYAFIGKGGTMKSILVFEQLLKFAISGNDAMFLNMEMSDATFLDRTYLRLFGNSLIDLIMSGSINENDIVGISGLIDSKLDKLHIVNENNLSGDDIKNALLRKQDSIKREIYALGVDSMNAMILENNSEAISAFNNTKSLKQTAKETKTCIMLINHVNSACDYTVRDTSSFVRGGSKVIDNCDAYFCTSKILDISKSTGSDSIYIENKFYLRFVNKRDTGRTINTIVTVLPDLQLATDESDAALIRENEF